VVNVIPSRSSGKVVSAMLHDMRVRVVSFTGSTEVGASSCMRRPKRRQAGDGARRNAPFIVFEDATSTRDRRRMIARCAQGEACTSANRFYVHEQVHDEFARKLTAKMAGLKVGNGSMTAWRSARWSMPTRGKSGRAGRGRGRQGAKSSPAARRRASRPFLSTDRARHVLTSPDAERGDFRPVADPDVQVGGRGDQRAKQPNTASSPISTPGIEPRHARLRKPRLRHDRANRGLSPDPAAPFGGMKRRASAAKARMRG